MNQSQARSQTTPYPEETRDLAFQIWAFRASQNNRQTAKLLASEYDGPTLTDETIRYWRDTEDWPNRLVTQVKAIAGGLHVKAAVDQLAGGPEALSLLRQVVNGDIEADVKTRVQAAIALADRAGYSPLGRTTAPQLPSDSASLPSGTEPATIDDLLARHRDRLNGTS